MTLTKKLISTKVAAVAVGLAMVFSLIAAVPANAQSTDLQAQIAALLAQVAALQAQLGQTSGTTGAAMAACTFTRDLTLGASGADVTCLQDYLKTKGHFTHPKSTGYFGSVTQAAVKAWQAANGVMPAAGYFGAKSRAAFSAMGGSGSTSGSGTTPVVSGTALNVMRAATSPANTTVIAGQAVADLAHFTFTNPTATEAKVTNLVLDRTGVSNDSTFSNIFLYNGAMRITDSASVSSGKITFNDASGIFMVPAGGTVTLSVRADIAGSTAGQVVGVALASVASNVALASTVVFPIAGNNLTIATADMADVAFAISTTPTGSPTIDPQDGVNLWGNQVSIGTRAVDLHSIAFRQIGSINQSDIKNFKLLIDGVQVGSTVEMLDSRGYVTFDLSKAPIRLNTGSRTIKLLGDVIGGSNRNFSFSLRQVGDAMFIDSELKQAVLSTGNDSSTSGTFAARTSGTQSINLGTLTVTKKTTSPSGNIVKDASNATLGVFEMKAAGEKLKVENLRVAVVEGNSENAYTLRNGALFANGVQVGSTAAIAATTDSTQGYTEFSLGSSLILDPGVVVTLEVKADIYDNDGANAVTAGDTVKARIVVGSTNVQRLVALTYLNGPTAAVDGNTLSVATGALTGSKYSAYANQTVVAPKTAMKLGEFRVVADSTEGVNLDTITVDFSSSSSTSQVSSYLTDVYVKYGTQTSPVKSTIASSGGDNTWNINYALPANGELAVEVYGTLGSSFGATDTIVPDFEVSGITANSAASVTTGEIAGQTITVNTGSVASENISDSALSSRLLVGNTSGSASPKVASFRFLATNDSFTLSDIALKVGSAAAAAGINSFTLKSTGMTDKTFSLNGTIGTSTGMSLNVPANDTNGRIVDVYANLNSVGNSAATSSNSIQVTLEGFVALATGSGEETESATDRAANTNYVFASIPTLTAGTLPQTAIQAQSNFVIGRVKVTADSAGQINWKKIVFTLSKSSGVLVGATSSMQLWQVGGSQIAGSFATTTGDFTANTQAFLTTDTSGTLAFVATDEQQITGGTTAEYEVRATLSEGSTWSGYEFVSLSIANPSTTRTAPSSYSEIGGAAGASSPSFAWSDRSSLSHGLTTADWHNDFLVKNLPLSLGTVGSTF